MKFPFKIVPLLIIPLLFAAESHDIELAHRFILLEKYEKAEEVLERLYAQNPDDPEVQNMLKETYKALKKYDKLENLINAMLLHKPDNSFLWVELGESYLAQNKPEQAWDAFDKAIEISPKSQAIVMQIHKILSLLGFIEQDIKFIKKARRRLGDKELLALELARLYEIKGRFGDAVSEYARYLKKFPDQFGKVERRIGVAERSNEELKQLRKSMNDLLRTNIPKWQPWRLIAIVEQKLGNYDNAFNALTQAEEAQQEKYRGRLMAEFAKDMLTIGNFTLAKKAAEYMIANASKNYSQRGQIYLAKALRGLGKFNDAIAQLDSAAQLKNVQLTEDALTLKGRILLENLHDYDGAEKAIEPIFSGSRWMRNNEAVAIKGEIFIYKRQFDRAKEFLNNAFQMNPKDETVAYLLAMTYFFSGNDDTALTAMHNVVSRFPKNPLGNETVELILIMQTAKEEIEKIREPLFLMFTHDTAEAVKFWDDIAKENNPSIGDYALWKLGMCQLFLDDTTAYSSLSNIVERYPKSFYAPLALEKIADRELKNENRSTATEIYVRIINEYPDAVNIEKIREKLRLLGGTF